MSPAKQPPTISQSQAKSETSELAPLNVFVHLAHNKDANTWRKAWTDGTLVGCNDITPYGYGRANMMGCHVTFSSAGRENMLSHFVRGGIRIILGFDLVHALSQRGKIVSSDVIWTHTESQFLAVSALLIWRRNRPKLIGQSVWLFDRWSHLGPIRRALYRFLMRRVDVLTTLSPANAEIARKILPEKRIEFVPFGLRSDEMVSSKLRTRVSIVAVGNDRDRDWETLISAVNDLKEHSVDILSNGAFRYQRKAREHVRIWHAKTNTDLAATYIKAAVAIVPVKHNFHASGITAILEATLAGVPVITSDTGGVRAYFDDNEVIYVPVGDPEALRVAIIRAFEQGTLLEAMVARAQARICKGPANLMAYIRRHVIISNEIMHLNPLSSEVRL